MSNCFLFLHRYLSQTCMELSKLNLEACRFTSQASRLGPACATFHLWESWWSTWIRQSPVTTTPVTALPAFGVFMEMSWWSLAVLLCCCYFCGTLSLLLIKRLWSAGVRDMLPLSYITVALVYFLQHVAAGRNNMYPC